MLARKLFWRIRLTLYVVLALMINQYGAEWARQLIYFPSHEPNAEVMQELQFYRFDMLSESETSDIPRGYVHINDYPEKIIVVFHGNAGQASDRIYIARGLLEQKAIIFLAEYPGYGERPGVINENSILNKAIEDVSFFKELFPELPFYLIGESLGSSVAVHVAKEVDVDGLVLISPFTSLADAAESHYQFIPMDYIVPDKFDSKSVMKDIEGVPMLVVHGTDDKIVPFELGQKLYDLHKGDKEFITMKGYGHNNLPWNNHKTPMWSGMNEFLNSPELPPIISYTEPYDAGP